MRGHDVQALYVAGGLLFESGNVAPDRQLGEGHDLAGVVFRDQDSLGLLESAREELGDLGGMRAWLNRPEFSAESFPGGGVSQSSGRIAWRSPRHEEFDGIPWVCGTGEDARRATARAG